MNIFDLFLVTPLLNFLLLFYKLFFSNLGVAIIALTVFIKIVLLPLVKPTLTMAKKQKAISGELSELKNKYAGDKKLMAQKQMELYKKHGFNPASGCVTQIAQLIVFIALYQVFIKVLGNADVSATYVNSKVYFDFLKISPLAGFNTHFLYLNLAENDKYFILPALAAVSQFFSSKIMMPQINQVASTAKNTPGKEDDMMYNMQKQMMYMAPIMTFFIGYKFPSGLVLYWFVSTALSVLQQWVIQKISLKKN